MSKVGTHPYIREKMGDNPVQSLLDSHQNTHYAHLRRKSQKVGLTALTKSIVALTPYIQVQNGSPIKCERLPSHILVGSRQKVGSNNQLGGIYVY